MFTQVIIRKQNTDGQTDGRTTDSHTDIQHETIIPRHYRVAGYNKKEIWIYLDTHSYLKLNTGKEKKRANVLTA